MKFVKYFLQKRSVTILLLLLVLGGGLLSYVKMGKLEDAPFTIKQALVLTPYPGASPSEVQSQVTDVLEESIQSLGELYYLKTENRAGLSKITVYVKKEIRADEMQQLWDKLRRKVNDVQSKLPADAGPSVVNDDFGDVLGVFYGLTGEGYSYRELEDQAKLIKNELLKVKDVAKVEIYGVQPPTIDVILTPSVMARSGITPSDISRAFEAQNRVVDAGGIDAGVNRIRIESTGNFYSLDDIRNLTIVSRTGEHFRLADIAEIKESYQTPPSNKMRINGSPAVGIAISTVPTGNVVNMAEAVKGKIEQFSETMPEGFELQTIYDQGYESAVANQGFIWNLIISVVTVVAILLFFIGFKNGILIGSGLVFSIFATLIVMLAQGIALQRMSLAAIIIAMGMLVDNFPNIAAMFPGNGLTTVLGISTVNAGMLGGILVGILTSVLHKKFHTVKFPMAFSFFQGVRFVPIISVFSFMILGNLFPFVWVFISRGINGLATILNQMGVFGLWLYGFVERLLIPTGLHQIWISVVRDTSVSGIFEFASGIVEGQRPAFMQYLAEGLPLNTTLREMVKFSYGPQIPMMLGALPAIGLAIYRCAAADKKKAVKPLILAGVTTAMIAGISEPLEFIFLFTAPVLYVIYAVLYGLSWVFMYLFGNQIGYGSGIIEFVVFGLLRSDSRWWVCVFVTIGEFIANYAIFRWFILKFNVKTPGRGGDYDASLEALQEANDSEEGSSVDAATDPKTLKALTIIKGLGGKDNIEEVDSCMSRLRVVLKDGSLVDKDMLNKTGCTAIRVIDDRNIQIIYGTTVGIIKESVRKQLKK